MDEARRVIVTGAVQGVGFRAWARDTAEELGLTGWVRNCPDGTVETHIEGSGHALSQMMERLNAGPPSGRVEHISAEAAEPSKQDEFEIRG